MAYADTYTLIPLARAAAILGINPWHFSSIYTEAFPSVISCEDDWYQYDWQSAGKVSRESLASAIQQAEEVTAAELGWWPLPKWIIDEEVILPRYHDKTQYNFLNARLKSKSLTTRWGMVVAPGRKASTLIEADSAVSFVDNDGDGFNESCEVVVSTIVTDDEEIRIYYPDKNGIDKFEIRPIDVDLDTTTQIATITFPKYLIPLENLIERASDPDEPNILIDGDDDTNFLQEVDVYRVYSDKSDQLTFVYEPGAYCSNSTEETTETGYMAIRNSRLGNLLYNRGDWNATTETFDNASYTDLPHRARISYYAGLRDNSLAMPTRQMNKTYEQKIVYYAITLLDKILCGCSNTQNTWNFQSEDYARSDKERSYNLPYEIHHNPFGTTVAAVNLYKYVKADQQRITK